MVQAGFIRTFESPLFSLDVTKESNQVLINHLRSRKLPCPAGCLPKGLKGVKGIGCRELVIDGKRGSLICFDEREAGVVHLVVFQREDVSGALPESDHPVLAPEWQLGGRALGARPEGFRAYGPYRCAETRGALF